MNTNTIVVIVIIAAAVVLGSVLQKKPNNLRHYEKVSLINHPADEPYHRRWWDKPHPSQMTTEELEREVFFDGQNIGPGLVEGDRYRGNLNL